MLKIGARTMRRHMTATIARAATLWLAAALVVAFTSVAGAADDRRPGAERFPNVTLTTQDGTAVRFYDDLIKGKTVALNLIYTTCTYACPLETAKMAQVQRLLGDRMGRDIFFYSITIDPEHDTPTVLKEYADRYKAGPGWLFLTGKKADIDLISKKLGLYSPPDPRNPDGHIPYLLVGNEATGQWMRNSAVDNPGFIARTIGDWLNSWQNAKHDQMKSYADVRPLKMTTGQYMFSTHCGACHTIGRGDRIGPDLRDVTATRDRAWLSRFIVEPDKMIAERDPVALSLLAKYRVRMPNLGLTKHDAAELVEYLEEQGRAAAATPAPTSSAPGPAPASANRARGDLKPIVDRYLRIQQALHSDSIEGIGNEARLIAAEAVKLGASGTSIQSAAGTLQQVANVKVAREGFGILSDAIITYAKQQDAGVGDDVKAAYCPMARKYWLQRGDKVQNPYYGKAMSECGRITAGLPDLAS
jgi:protein SCO1/2